MDFSTKKQEDLHYTHAKRKRVDSPFWTTSFFEDTEINCKRKMSLKRVVETEFGHCEESMTEGQSLEEKNCG